MIPQDYHAVLSDLENLTASIGRFLRDLEQIDMAEFFGDFSGAEARQDFEIRSGTAVREAEDGIRWALKTLHARLLLYCEVFGLAETRRAVQEWRERWPDDRLAETRAWSTSEADGRESEAFSDIQATVDGIVVLLRPKASASAPTPVDRHEHARLEHCLRSLAKIVRERGVTPTCEADVQQVMHSHLEGVFSDYTRTLTIAKPLLSFKPDGGVISLRAAIECKFVADADEVAVAMHGLHEDLSGYSGSRDWKNFYTFIYMTEAFTTESHVARALGTSDGEGTWTAIVVTGKGARLPRVRRTSSDSGGARTPERETS